MGWIKYVPTDVLIESLVRRGALEETEEALIHYRHGVNTGTLRARNTLESIAAAVRQYEQASHGPIGVERMEVRTRYERVTAWQEVGQRATRLRP